jgi:GxxExxY protein
MNDASAASWSGPTLDSSARFPFLCSTRASASMKASGPVHEAQLLTYLRMSRVRIGLIMNFAAPRLKDGLRRFVV